MVSEITKKELYENLVEIKNSAKITGAMGIAEKLEELIQRLEKDL